MTPKFDTTKFPPERHGGKRGKWLSRKPPGVRAPDDRADSPMPATESETADAIQTRGTTAAQTHFDARNTLAGELDDTTVRQAVGEGR